MRIPMFCPTCEKFYPSNIELTDGFTGQLVMKGNVGRCSVGHPAFFLDGAYTIRNGILNLQALNPEVFLRITELALGVAKEEIDPDVAFKEISSLSPELSAIISAAAGTNISLKTILIWLAICISTITGGTAIAAQFVQNIRTIFGEAGPSPDVIINNSFTINNKIAGREVRRRASSNSLIKEQIRKQKQVAKKAKAKKRKKLHRQKPLGKR